MVDIDCKPAHLPMPRILSASHESIFQIPYLKRMREKYKINDATKGSPARFVTRISPRPRRKSADELDDIDSICKREFYINYDKSRVPEFLLEIKCSRKDITLNNKNFVCQPVKYYYAIYRKSGVDADGSCTYNQTVEPVTVGCTLVDKALSENL
ncbi:hypothetical protein ACF0H5_017848 [Mactra antiquata]